MVGTAPVQPMLSTVAPTIRKRPLKDMWVTIAELIAVDPLVFQSTWDDKKTLMHISDSHADASILGTHGYLQLCQFVLHSVAQVLACKEMAPRIQMSPCEMGGMNLFIGEFVIFGMGVGHDLDRVVEIVFIFASFILFEIETHDDKLDAQLIASLSKYFTCRRFFPFSSDSMNRSTSAAFSFSSSQPSSSLTFGYW